MNERMNEWTDEWIKKTRMNEWLVAIWWQAQKICFKCFDKSLPSAMNDSRKTCNDSTNWVYQTATTKENIFVTCAAQTRWCKARATLDFMWHFSVVDYVRYGVLAI